MGAENNAITSIDFKVSSDSGQIGSHAIPDHFQNTVYNPFQVTRNDGTQKISAFNPQHTIANLNNAFSFIYSKDASGLNPFGKSTGLQAYHKDKETGEMVPTIRHEIGLG